MKLRILIPLLACALAFCSCGGGEKVVPEGDTPGDIVPDNPPAQTEEIDPGEGTTVYGVVSADGQPLAGVRVSDGVLFARTDSEGVYRLKSAKKHGYVFVILPTGYMPACRNNVFPQFFATLSGGARECERADFPLLADGDQKKFRMLVFGDMQIADRSDDIAQFRHFTAEIARDYPSSDGIPTFALTLGDMSWDSHWSKYDLNNYVTDIKRIGKMPVFHAIGNHDHDLAKAGDFDSVVPYKKIIGPTYYSFNIGGVHFVMLDDIECTNDGTGVKATYNDVLVDEQMDWLREDLSAVSKSTPLVVVLHAPLYKDSGSYSLDNGKNLEAMLSPYADVLVQSGHTHIMYNVDKTSDKHIMEQNSGAVCGTWWYTGYDVPWLHIGRDGSPGGYRVCEFDSGKVRWYFKGVERPADFQFRSYDRNQICITAEKYTPGATEEYKQTFTESVGEYGQASSDNWVYINVWDWDPEWKVEVFEGSKSLKVTKFEGFDPLHVIAYNAKRASLGKKLDFATKNTKHLFKAQASSPSSTLVIKVTDRFGREYVETMQRPKPFTLEQYM